MSDRRIAIIGTGISGLTCAYLLNDHYDITLFECNNYIGGHTNTVRVVENKRYLDIDTGFIVFNEQNYPNLCRLFERLEVPAQDSDMSFSVHCLRSGLFYNGTSLSSLFVQRCNLFNLAFIGMLGEILRFNRHARELLKSGISDSITVHDFINSSNYSSSFYEHYLVPLGASLWSSPAARFRHFPIKFVLDFLNNHSMLQVNSRPTWKTVSGGSAEYVKRMTRPFIDRIHLSQPGVAVRRAANHVELVLADGRKADFDEVIIATHSDQALKLLAEPWENELEILGSFRYEHNEVALHTDTRLLPPHRNAWASWNYRLGADDSQPAAVTYNMNMLQSLPTATTYCVSLNQTEAIDNTRIIARYDYTHPQFSPGRDDLQARHAELIRGYGFHEDGVNSALAVCSDYRKSLLL
mgnify:CR=1 FL=1